MTLSSVRRGEPWLSGAQPEYASADEHRQKRASLLPSAVQKRSGTAKLEDVRERERVRGEVRIEKENDKKRQIALKIYIDRPKPVGGEGG
jgi:hypothetical protein